MMNPNITVKVEERVKRKAVEDLIMEEVLDQDLEEDNNNNKMELEVTLNNASNVLKKFYIIHSYRLGL
jgi:hypothetical protein